MIKMISKTIENLINTTYHTKSLKENGVIERIGSTKKGTWQIKKLT